MNASAPTHATQEVLKRDPEGDSTMYDSNQQAHPDDLARSLTLRDVIAPLFRHHRVVVLSFLGIPLGALLLVFLLPKQYEAQMKILVKRDRIDNGLVALRADVREEELNSEVELLKSRDLLEKVVLTCGLHRSRGKAYSRWVFFSLGSSKTDQDAPNAGGIPQAVRTLEKNLQVEPLRKTSLIRVTYRSPEPQAAATVLATLANLYLEKHVTVYRPPGAFDFFQRETERYQKELGSIEARLTDFNRDQGVVSAQVEKEMTLQKLTEFDATLRTTQVAIDATEKRISELKSQLAASPPRLTTQIRTADSAALVQQLKSTLLSLELKRTELLDKFMPDYRPVQEVEKQIAQTRAAIAAAERAPVREETTDRDPTREWMRAELAKSRTELADLHARAIAMSRVVRAYSDKARLIDQKGTAQQSLLRAAKAAEENYLLYLHKQEEARISDALDRQRIVDVAIAETPTVPSQPIGPRLLTSVLLGALLASFVGVGLAFALDYLDPSLRTPHEVRALLNVPVLAAVPKTAR